MFNDKYKNAMDSVSPSAETKERILDQIILKEEIKKHKNPAIPWRIAFACVACIAIILGIIFVPQDSFVPAVQSNNDTQTLMVSKSYDEIYKLIKPKKKVPKKTVIIRDEVVTDDGVYEVIEEEVEYATGNDMSALPGDTAATNDSNKSENVGNIKTDPNDEEFSNTTEQVEGVAEADIVKTDGKYIYYLIGNELSIYKASGKDSELISKTTLERQQNENFGDMFLKEDRLILLQQNDYINEKNYVTVIIYDVSNPQEIKRVAKSCQEGTYNSSRMVGDYMYLISNCYINISSINKDDPSTFVPTVEINDVCKVVPADRIYRYEEEKYNNQYTVIGAFNYKDGNMSDTASMLGGTDNIYCSKGNIILADRQYKSDSDIEGSYSVNNTRVSRLEIKDGKIEYKASGEVEGELDNQFFIDENNGYFRFVTTTTIATQTKKNFENSPSAYISYSSESFARLTILDSSLKKVGEITNLAEGERVYSVRFMGDTAYFVTFRQTDPLFSADLSDPENPKILGQLKIPGFSEYMYPYGDGLLLGFGMDADENTGRTKDLKLSMFNITDPSNVIEQDKTIVEGYNYSIALENHKSMLVSPTKNLIGFDAFDNKGIQKYMVYEYTDSGFNLKAQIAQLSETKEQQWKYYDSIRGLFIGEHFYLVSDLGLQVFNVKDFAEIATIK